MVKAPFKTNFCVKIAIISKNITKKEKKWNLHNKKLSVKLDIIGDKYIQDG